MYGTFDNVLETIGKTPLIRLNRVAEGLPCPIYGKVEFFNPGQSIKDRIGRAMIEKAEREGILKPGVSTIIEATAGNTGVGLALVAAVKGYRCIFVMPDKMSQEKVNLLRAYGAEVVMVPTNVAPDSPDSYGSVAKRLANEIPNAWRPDQFTNLANPEIHYLTTGPEIWEQTQGKVTVFVSGIGTGGTISGVGKYLKERNPKVRIVGADPDGSVLSGGTPKPWKVEGIGEDYVPKTLNSQVVDDWVRVTDSESFMTARKIARLEGMLIGGSCGTCVAAALKYAERCSPNDLMVVVMPDTGRNYLSKCYNDEWMRENGFMDDSRKPATAADVLGSQGQRELLYLRPDQTMQDAIDMCREEAISQIPIIELTGASAKTAGEIARVSAIQGFESRGGRVPLDGGIEGRVVGGIQEVTLARLLHEGYNPRQVRLREIMARPLPEVDESVTTDEIYRLLLSGNTGVVVRRQGKISGIITRIDLVNFWDRTGSQNKAAQPVATA